MENRLYFENPEITMSGAVYQPTTVTYEGNAPRERWQDRPISYLASTVSQTARRPCGITSSQFSRKYMPLCLITSGIFSFCVGLMMMIHGALEYAESPDGMYLIITIFGALFFAMSILCFVFFLRLTRRICWRNIKDHVGASGNQALTINPSTDLLVAAQYAPVSEVAYKPNKLEDTENSKLMPEIKLTNEDMDIMVENDPRIVLHPLNAPTAEET